MAGLTFHSSESNSGTTATWTIASKTLPAGRLYIAIGWYRSAGSAQRTLNSIAHPAITSAAVVTTADSQTARFFFGSDPDKVVGLELWQVESNGGTGDLVLTFSNDVWAPALAIFSAIDVDVALTLGTGTQGDGNAVSATASHADAEYGLALAYGTVANDTAVCSASPWAADVALTPASYRRFGAAHSNATAGVTQTFALDGSKKFTAAVAMEVLFAPPPIIDAALAAQAATADGEIITHLVDAALQADPATASADLAVRIALQAAIAAQAGSASGAIDHVEGIAALPAADPATAAAQLASPLGLQAALAARRAEISAIVAPAASLTWPSSLPPPEARPFAVSARPEVARGRAELGPGSGHRLTAETGERQRVQLILDVSQVATFEAFWQSTGYGALPFLGPRHVDDTQIQLVFASDPVIESLEGGGHWRISFELERQWP